MSGRWLQCIGLALAGAALAGAARAADAAEIELGLSVYKTTCASCHAWTGNGVMPYDPGEGFLNLPPSLVRSTLERAAMIELLACGTPGGQMPQYLAEAWSEQRRCYGKLAGDLPPEARPPRPYSTLGVRQIEALASFVQEFYQGKGLTLANCLKYFGPPARLCDLLR